VLTATGGAQYSWSNSQSGATITVSPAGTTTYTVTVTDANGCTDVDDVDVVVTPGVAITVARQDPACANTNDGQLTVTVTAGVAPYVFNVTGQAPLNSSNTTEVFTGLSDGTYTVSVTDASGCSIVSVNNVITSPDSLDLGSLVIPPACYGVDTGSITLFNSSLTYSFNGSPFSSNLSYTGLTAGDYVIIAQDANGCRDTVVKTVTQPDSLEVYATPDSITITQGEAVSLQTQVIGGTVPYTYSWTPTDRLSCTDCTDPVASPLDTISYTIQVTDVHGCTKTDSVLINVKAATKLVFPTAFTPGDNNKINDLFRPILTGELDAFKMMIFNRWGEKVFETTNYKVGWDGVYNGEPQPIATYVFLVEYTPAGGITTMIDKGNFTLLR
jgi:gliding motility-associated-like protein